LLFSKFFTVHTIRGHCVTVTPQEMLKVRCHQDLRYYFFSSHAIRSWNISQKVLLTSAVWNRGARPEYTGYTGYSPSRARSV